MSEHPDERRIADIKAKASDPNECSGALFIEVRWLIGRLVEAQATIERLHYIATQLFGMVPRQVWRDQGGDDGQGHYEGDYYAERIRDELAALSGGGK